MKKFMVLSLFLICAAVIAAEPKGWREATTPTEETSTTTWRKFWQPRFKEKLAQAQQQGKKIDVVLVGDSLTHNWDGSKRYRYQETFAGHTVLNLGFGGDRTEHTLWVINNNKLWKHLDPKLVVLLIGTNNTPRYSPEATIEGIRLCVKGLKKRAPHAKIVIFAIFPRGKEKNYWLRPNINRINAGIKRFADGKTVFFENINARFLNRDGSIIEKTMRPDFIHLSEEGYRIWAEALKKYL